MEALSYEEAAAVLDVPVGTARSHPSRARAALHVFPEGEVVDEGRGRAGKVKGQGAA